MGLIHIDCMEVSWILPYLTIGGHESDKIIQIMERKKSPPHCLNRFQYYNNEQRKCETNPVMLGSAAAGASCLISFGFSCSLLESGETAMVDDLWATRHWF